MAKCRAIYVSTTPAELLVVEGEPQFASIPGTTLSYVSNTGCDIFVNSANNMYYILLSGRWFSTAVVAERPVDVRSGQQACRRLHQDPGVQPEGRRAGLGSRHTASQRGGDRQLDSADRDHHTRHPPR